MPNVAGTLSSLGLRENEIKIYLSLLSHKEGMFVYEISRETGVKRTTVNVTLERLHKNNFVTFHLDGARRRFMAEAPETLLYRFESSLGDLRALIPILHAANGDDKRTKVRFFEGKDGIEAILADVLITLKMSRNPKKELLEISSGHDIYHIQPDHRQKFIDKRVCERIPIRWITYDSEIARELRKSGAKEFREIKFFDGKRFRFDIDIDIYSDKIALLNLGKNPSGVIIENKSLTNSFRSLFNLLWSTL